MSMNIFLKMLKVLGFLSQKLDLLVLDNIGGIKKFV